MYALYAAVEHTGVSVWMRENEYAYFIALIFHALGMALLVGAGLAISLRVLGVAAGAGLHRFRGFFPVMWLGAALAVVSGCFLLAAYPAKALTNPVFGLKLICLLGAAWLLRSLARTALPAAARGAELPRGTRWRAGLALGLWLGGVVAGKLLLHTNRVLMVG
jgi:hypothetical protein